MGVRRYGEGTPRDISIHFPSDNRLQLIFNDGSKRMLAQFHRRSLGLFSSKGSQPAYLEIVPGYESMVDLIFFTFIFVEKIRKDQERGMQNVKGD